MTAIILLLRSCSLYQAEKSLRGVKEAVIQNARNILDMSRETFSRDDCRWCGQPAPDGTWLDQLREAQQPAAHPV